MKSAPQSAWLCIVRFTVGRKGGALTATHDFTIGRKGGALTATHELPLLLAIGSRYS